MGIPKGTTPRPKRVLGIQGPNSKGQSIFPFKKGSTKGSKKRLWQSGK